MVLCTSELPHEAKGPVLWETPYHWIGRPSDRCHYGENVHTCTITDLYLE